MFLKYFFSVLVILFGAASDSDRWSYSEEEAPFVPTTSVLERWADDISRIDTNVDGVLRAATPERDDKVMKKPVSPDRIVNKPPNKQPDASETDLFLLGAIEKLAYRLDFMEKRTRRLEEMMYQLVSGSNSPDGEPCPNEFSRMNGACYHISTKQLNWKSASSMCRGMGGVLLELQGEDDRTKFIAGIQSDPVKQGSDFWTGGLNPGLLWLWGSSAKPVATNTTSSEIQGNGRCLLLAYLPPTRRYQYRGADCSSRYRYICQLEDNATERRLQRLLRDRSSASMN